MLQMTPIRILLHLVKHGHHYALYILDRSLYNEVTVTKL